MRIGQVTDSTARRGREGRRRALLLACLGIILGAARARAQTLTVDDCVRLALARSPAALAAAAEVRAAEEQIRAARAAYVPRLLVQAEYGHPWGFSEVVTNGGSTAALLTLEASLLDGGLRAAQLGAAQARLHSAAAIERQRRADTGLAVRSAYFTALAARAEREIQSDTARRMRNDVTLLQRLETGGLVPHNDVLRAQLALESAHTAQRSAEAALDTASAELTALTGTDIGTDLLVEPGPIGSESPTEGMAEASPVMEDARAAIEAARREADIVRSERRERLTLVANGGFLGVDPGPTFSNNGGGQFLLGFALPIFDGGASAARIAGAVAATDAAEANAAQVRQTIRVALSRVEVEARRAQAELDAWTQAVARSEEAFQLMRARYVGGGSVRLLEVLDAQTQSVDARLNVVRARLAYRLAVAMQDQILGRTGQ